MESKIINLTRINKILLCLILLITKVSKNYSQEPVNVVTRRIEKEFIIQQKDHININAERGIIKIKGWTEKKVRVTLKIVAKNKELETAREEVQHMNYILTQNRNEIILKNFLLLPARKEYNEISSIIRAEYEIFIPVDMSISIQNTFGSVSIRNLNSFITANLEYSDLTLQNTNTQLDLFINTGDFVCSHSDLNAKIETRYSQINFHEVKGDIKLIMMYGNINISLNKELTVNLFADRTDIMLINRDCFDYNYIISGEYTSLRFQPDCYFKNWSLLNLSYKDDMSITPWTLHYLSSSVESKLKIEARFGTIYLN